MINAPHLQPVNIKLLLCLDGEQFVSETYDRVLGRQADPGGLMHHLDLLNCGVSKLEIIRRMRFSQEGRLADVKVDGLRVRLAMQKLSKAPLVGQLFNSLSGGSAGSSAEFNGQTPSVLAAIDPRNLLPLHGQRFITAVYLQILGREPDEEGLLHHLSLLEEGVTQLEIIKKIWLSEEGRKAGVTIPRLDKLLSLEKLCRSPRIGWAFSTANYVFKFVPGYFDVKTRISLGSEIAALQNKNMQRQIDQLHELVSQLVSKNHQFYSPKAPHDEGVRIAEDVGQVTGARAARFAHLDKAINALSARLADASDTSNATNNSVEQEVTRNSLAQATVVVSAPLPEKTKLAKKHFDADWYLHQNIDLTLHEIDPYSHYFNHGRFERRRARYFDAPHYLQKNKDLGESDLDIYAHYKKFGKDEGRDVRYFDPQAYLDCHADLAASDIDPYEHYVECGFAAGWKSDRSISDCAIFFDPKGGYVIDTAPAPYTYIPPRRPYDISSTVESLSWKPFFSILVPVYNTPPELLAKLLRSVEAQWYQNWELIFADDASQSLNTQTDLAKVSDGRISVIRLSKNKGIAGATNAALAQAKGDFVVLLDHDDELTEDCLYELAICIARDNPDYIYSDEDKINQEGVYAEPHFKPAWSPDALMSTMYVCHVACVRRTLFEKIGGLRSTYDGCQDWDMVLRIAEHTSRITHIPKVLYHWRIIPASIAADIAAKPYVLDASKRVREDALVRRGLVGEIEPVEEMTGYFRVNYRPKKNSLISIIIPSRDNAVILKRCVESILTKSSYENFELIVMDNGSVESSTEDYFEELRSKLNATVIRHDAPFNFSELNNIGVTHAQGEVLLFLNDDTEVISPDWLERMMGYAQLPHVGAVGAKLLYPDHSVQHAGLLNLEDGPGHAFLRSSPDMPGYYMRNLLEYNWLAVTGACLMVERFKYEQVGKFDETFPIAYNDVELCFRLRDTGYFNLVCQAVRLIHHESVSRGTDHHDQRKLLRLKEEKRRLYQLHPRYFQYDPFFSINLHPNGINFESV